MVKTLPGRNDPCHCGSGKKYKQCCARTAERPVDAPYVPQIDPKLRDLERREAEFWRPLEGGRVACDLCYRRCELADGEAGWCKYRKNEGGRMVIPEHGTLSSMIRQQRAYQVDPFAMYKVGARSIFIGLTHCTAGCLFCMSKEITWRPSTVPWVSGKTGQMRILKKGEARRTGNREVLLSEKKVLGGADILLPNNSWFYGERGRYTPAQVIDNALRAGAEHILFGINEPTLSIEYTLDVARLAKQHGLEIILESNGFTTPEAIRALAPLVSAVVLGIKGSADPAFCERWLRSPGAIPHLLEAARTWHDCGVHLTMLDVIAPPHMQSDDVAIEAQERLYGWIAEELSPLVPLLIMPMLVPGPKLPDGKEHDFGGWLLAKGGDIEQSTQYEERMAGAMFIAQSQGLLYAHIKVDDTEILCHNCGAQLVSFRSPMLHCHPCTMPRYYCPFWTHKENVTQGGLCANCGAQTPVIPMTPEQRRRHERWLSSDPDPGEAKRPRWKTL